MSELRFLSPALAAAGYRSPFGRALEGTDLRDLSRLGKLELRGDLDVPVDGEIVRVTPRRALVLCEASAAPELAAQLGAVDVSAALAGLALRGERLMRRLTDLDLDALPAAGAVAGVQTTVLRNGDEFRLFFAQEYAEHVAAVVLDALEGLR